MLFVVLPTHLFNYFSMPSDCRYFFSEKFFFPLILIEREKISHNIIISAYPLLSPSSYLGIFISSLSFFTLYHHLLSFCHFAAILYVIPSLFVDVDDDDDDDDVVADFDALFGVVTDSSFSILLVLLYSFVIEFELIVFFFLNITTTRCLSRSR